MKVAKSFSLEQEVLAKFTETCGKQGMKPGHVLQQLMRAYIINYEEKKINYIECKECGAKYTELLHKCPQCKQKEVEKATSPDVKNG